MFGHGDTDAIPRATHTHVLSEFRSAERQSRSAHEGTATSGQKAPQTAEPIAIEGQLIELADQRCAAFDHVIDDVGGRPGPEPK